jgi:MFS family permease
VDTNAATASLPWYRSLNREQWRVLAASNLGWLFDGFEIYALFLTVGFALHQLLQAAQYAEIPRYAGYILATTVFGWATGGVIGGIIADYIGRKRTMMLAILAYSLTTGLSAFACGKGGGLVQMGAGIGSVLASGVWLAIGGLGPNAWRWMYLIGVLPALITLWIRRNIPESPRWEGANERRREAHALKRSGADLEGENRALTRFTLVDMFADRTVRRPLIFSFLMMLSVTFAFWGVGTFIPTYVGSFAAKAGFSAPTFAAWAGLVSSVCGVFGFISLGFLADAIGRKPTAMLWYAMCLVLTPVVYVWAQDLTTLLVVVGFFGFFTLGIWAWAPIWLPELFPTRMRGTAVAFCFNSPRFISCLGPLIAGTLIGYFGGYGPAATIIGLFFILGIVAAPFLPETNGKPLPERIMPGRPALTS